MAQNMAQNDILRQYAKSGLAVKVYCVKNHISHLSKDGEVLCGNPPKHRRATTHDLGPTAEPLCWTCLSRLGALMRTTAAPVKATRKVAAPSTYSGGVEMYVSTRKTHAAAPGDNQSICGHLVIQGNHRVKSTFALPATQTPTCAHCQRLIKRLNDAPPVQVPSNRELSKPQLELVHKFIALMAEVMAERGTL